jgi:hypothetical protein
LLYAIKQRILALLLVGPLVAFSTLFQISPASADTARPIDVVSISWPGAQSLGHSANELRAIIDDFSIGYWKRQVNIEFSDGITDTNLLTMASEAPCFGNATATYMNQVAAKFYGNHNLDPKTRYLFILMPRLSSNCIWEAKSLVGDYRTPFGITLLQDSVVPNVITHELGHALGLGHTNLMTCQNGVDGNWDTCQNNEYAGAVDMMSNLNVQGSLNIYDRWRIGNVSSSNIKSVQESGELILNPPGSQEQNQGLYINDGSSVYWVEYRKAADGYKSGLAVYRSDTPNSKVKIISPNVEYNGQYSSNSSGDIWLLNIGDFKYSAVPTGSPTGLNFKTYSGNVTLEAIDYGTSAKVKITVKPDVLLYVLPSPPSDLSRYNIATSDLGNSFTVAPVMNGNSLDDPTLQICNAKYASEKHRTSRSQLAATPISTQSSDAKKYSFISSEAVQYDSKFWAAATLNELDLAVSKCSGKNGKAKKLSYIAPNGVNARSYLVITHNGGNTQNLYATFQVKDSILVGTYVISNQLLPNFELKRWLQVSQKLGTRL